MKRGSDCLVVGVGSPFGDDRLGWIVADELQHRRRSNALVRKASSPADVLDWLPGSDRLLICDACWSPGTIGKILRFDWPDGTLATLRFSGTHDLNLPAVLDLAGRLSLLPSCTTIWSVTIADPVDHLPHDTRQARSFADSDGLSPDLASAIPALVAQIEQEISHA